MRHFNFLAIAFILVLAGCKNSTATEENEKDLSSAADNIIFDTDMGNDIDDAMALDILYKYANSKKINLLGIMLNKQGSYPVEYIDLMNTWYGHPEIPIGTIVDGKTGENNETCYPAMVCKETNEDGSPVYKRTLDDYSNLLESHILYRKLLASQPDSSVTIVSVGFSTNLARLMETEADEYSDLNGMDLISKKVKRLITMAGNIVDKDYYEYNVKIDVPAAKKVFHEWPTAIITSPWELGNSIIYPATSIENDFSWTDHHPVAEGYAYYMQMPYDRQTWDITAVLYALDDSEEYFTLSAPGSITITDEGATLFEESASANRYFLTSNEDQQKAVLDYFLKVIPDKPENYR